MTIYFKALSEGYVQNGSFKVTKRYKQGFHHQQGYYQELGVTADPTTLPVLPDNFYKEYAQFVTVADPATADPEAQYDVAAYNLSTPMYTQEIEVPRVEKVTLVYMYDTNGARPSRNLVVYQGPMTDIVNGKLVDAGNPAAGFRTDIPREGVMYNTHTDVDSDPLNYYGCFGVLPGVFERYGKILPKNVRPANVDELRVIKGDFVKTDGAAVTDVVLYVNPMWMNNQLPLFDTVYIHGEDLGYNGTGLTANDTLVASRLVRWRGGLTSQNRAFINFTDHSNGEDFSARFGTNPTGTTRIDQNLVEDGVEYKNADMYNVTNTRR